MLLVRQTVQRLFSASGAFPALGGGLNANQTRTKVRIHLPFATEVKRVRKQGFKKLTQTASGRNQLRERILKGNKVIAQ